MNDKFSIWNFTQMYCKTKEFGLTKTNDYTELENENSIFKWTVLIPCKATKLFFTHTKWLYLFQDKLECLHQYSDLLNGTPWKIT